MPAYGITIRDTARPAIRRLLRGLEDGKHLPAIGAAGERTLKDHFTAKNLSGATHATANRLGARPTQMFADFADATRWETAFQGVNLVVSDGRVNQRLNGGTIVPTGGRRYLTIPATSAAYGIRAREASVNLVFAFALNERGRWQPALVAETNYERTVSRGKNAGQVKRAAKGQKATQGAGKVWFWLARRVTQKPDPTVIPTETELRDRVEDALRVWTTDQFKAPTS